MNQPWWKEAVAYQIYPRSFQDSNGDGMGDLPGILSRLDHLQSLGVNVVWLCPMYKSPQDDNGYDISDYQDIHAEFGTMEDFDALLSAMHERGMKLIIDLVINHTSDEHRWFIESRDPASEKRDWYIWRCGKDGKEPNNWESIFGGSAWKLDEQSGQYFLHLFSTRQPDLNWENLEMRGEVYKMIRWWLDKGIDGFRIDAISHMKKEPGLPDLPNPEGKPYVRSFPFHMNVPGVLDYLREICRETFAHYDVMTVGEANGVSSEDAHEWVGEGPEKLNMLFQFEHLGLWNTDPSNRIKLAKLKEVLTRWQKCGVWNALYVENHDIPRVISKWGDSGNFWRESATSIAALYFLMRGTPFIYQGQEIGMTNTQFNSLQDFNDVSARSFFRAKRAEDWSDERILAELGPTSRDNARTPMQWESSPQAGFTTGKPWLKVNPNFSRINVEAQEKNPRSILNFYRALARLRRENPVFVHGEYELLLAEHPQVFAYERRLGEERVAVVCNLSGSEVEVPLTGELLLGNYEGDTANYWPYECRVIRMA
ncbi:MAG: glycoside hydrolase family 13 protein, partial [Bdellovibrionota bacterium]